MAELQGVDVLVVGGGATGAGVVRDLARRGLRSLLVERGDFATGTTGRYHGLLHSGGRYAAKDPLAAHECIVENRTLRRIAPASIEDTGGYFVATPDDPEDYVAAFPAACKASDVDCEEIPVAKLLAREPAINPKVWRAFRVPDGSIEPWQMVEANLADARAHGSDAWSYCKVVGFDIEGGKIVGATLQDERTGSVKRIATGFVIAAAGAWTGQIAALAGVEVTMTPGKGVMLIYNHRMTDAVINRCHKSSDGDIMVPVHTVAILGTTDQHVPDPDDYDITRDEVQHLVAEGSKLFPDLPNLRILRTYAGVRPLYQPPKDQAPVKDDRAISRAHTILDHADAGIENFISIVGGKLTTFRLMAEQTVDVACEKLGVTERCTTADEILPGQVPGHTYWLGHRFAEHEDVGGGDANLLCECEFVTRPMLEGYLDEHWPCTLDDIRRGTRLGMGPCQGGFCMFRAAGLIADRLTAGSKPVPHAVAEGTAGGVAARPHASRTNGEAHPPVRELAETTDRAITSFFRERYKGTRPIGIGRQLQELFLVTGVYFGTLGMDALPEPHVAAPGATSGNGSSEVAPDATLASATKTVEVPDASR